MNIIENVITVPNTWILLFKLKNSEYWKYIDCKDILSFEYAKQLIPDNNEFQKVKKHKTKVSWNNEQMDICIDLLEEIGQDLILK